MVDVSPIDKLLHDMRMQVEWTDVATMPIPLYERMKSAIASANIPYQEHFSKNTAEMPENRPNITEREQFYGTLIENIAIKATEDAFCEEYTDAQMEAEDNDPIPDAYAKGYADGFKACALKREYGKDAIWSAVVEYEKQRAEWTGGVIPPEMYQSQKHAFITFMNKALSKIEGRS